MLIPLVPVSVGGRISPKGVGAGGLRGHVWGEESLGICQKGLHQNNKQLWHLNCLLLVLGTLCFYSINWA